MCSKLAMRSGKWVQETVSVGQHTLGKMLGSGSEFGGVSVWRAGP